METEIWKDIKGYEGYYQVSNKGNVRSLDRVVENGVRKRKMFLKGKVLKNNLDKKGYHRVNLNKGGKCKLFCVHRMVAENFIPKIEGKQLINHKDGNKRNNAVENLEWCDHKENLNHAFDNQLIRNNFRLYKDKIKEEYLDGEVTTKELHEKYNCSETSIRNFLKKEGIELKKVQRKSKYGIKREVLKKEFEEGKRPKELSEKYNCNLSIICNYFFKWKKGIY